MLASLDVRRTEGGLQLAMTAPDAPVAWVTRLSYEQAQELAAGLRADVPVFLGGTVAAGLAYIPGYPEVGEGSLARIAEAEITDDLRNATYQVRAGLEAMRGFGDTVRAHLPDRLDPLPADPAAPWTPAPLD
ncbi:hypothetical protein CU254_40915 (plasmid) [Amycolatopsis sp. AA4]|uniref:hypothetical protein n=1 Tax=Actinomycetes TaxID=1760 RepID=UPI0001B56193|nr:MULTISPECIES: hypothetical protein [Actinomycetes]ATY16958.1 hypothetical protein CU254_40915 [Amycolatopsis sp. AA4]EFL12556.1 predicted protein [Streptomyces sp. AA4]